MPRFVRNEALAQILRMLERQYPDSLDLGQLSARTGIPRVRVGKIILDAQRAGAPVAPAYKRGSWKILRPGDKPPLREPVTKPIPPIKGSRYPYRKS